MAQFAKMLQGNDSNIEDSIRMLSQLLYKHYRQKTVILIDEYDVPLDKAFQNGYYKEMVSLIRGIFGQALKTNEFLQFAVLTGCLRVSKESIFTGLNNFEINSIVDIDHDEQFGFTDYEVKKILEDEAPEVMAEYEPLVPMFREMEKLAAILRKRRHKRGSIDFDFPESKITLNGAGRALDVQPYEANVATEIIEDFMLMAYETVAREYCQGDYPFVYRTHETPDPERVESLLTLLRNQGVPVQKAGEEITPKEIQEILESIHGLPNETMISRLTLRTMKQAKYTTQCSGHFGLAAKYYCHFTSPIRRYPDLQIHRIIRDNIRGRLQREGKTEHYREILETVAEQSSVCERRAQEAERESDRLKKAEYMSYHLGEEYEGIISGVTAYGFYVELPNTVEGLVHVTSLRDDYYSYNEETYELSGELSKKVYHLGQKVRVRVADADALRRTVDFTVVE